MPRKTAPEDKITSVILIHATKKCAFVEGRKKKRKVSAETFLYNKGEIIISGYGRCRYRQQVL